MCKRYYCYIIYNENDRTYNGYTVDLKKRLRQHNGEIKGGARATTNKGSWAYLVIMTSDDWTCISDAMKHEWSIKYPTRKRPRPNQYNGKRGRIESLVHVFEHVRSVYCCNISCYVHIDYYDILKDIIDCNHYDFVDLKHLSYII